MKLVATADTHGALPEIEPCDILLIGGDVCPVQGNHSIASQKRWIRHHFAPWLADVPAKDVDWIGGNHDFVCEAGGPNWEYALRATRPHAKYLFNEVVEIQGLKIFGSPMTPNLRNWAFFLDDPDWRLFADKLPDADIYLLHSPPQGILCGSHNEWGSPFMASALYKKKPKAVICGHIHEGFGVEKIGKDEIPFYNVAYVGELYDFGNPRPPVVIEL